VHEPRPPAPTRQRRKDARPQELLDAALSLFVEKGFAATRAEEVAHLAGVSKGTLYLYYTSKEELLKAVISAFLGTEIREGTQRIDRYEGTMSEAMHDALATWWLHVYEGPASGVFKLIITEVRNFPDIAEYYLREVVEPGKELIGRIVRTGIERGEFRPVDIESAVQSLVLPLVMMCLHKHSLAACSPEPGQIDARQFIEHHVDLILHGLRAGAPRPAAPPTAAAAAACCPAGAPDAMHAASPTPRKTSRKSSS
jgi:AcrR family transcriptional regulator